MKGSVERVDLVVAAAHELKAPLVLIRHLAQSLTSQNLDATQQEAIERILLTAERSLRLTSQLTSSSRLENIKDLDLKDTLEPVNVQVICERALHEMSPFANKLNQQIRFIKRRSGNHVALANADILHGIVVNLIDNAVRHNQTGGTVELSVALLQRNIRLQVKDNGQGIQKSEMNTLGKTLGNQPQPFNARPGTSGLGLYVAGRLAAAMGGTLGLGRPKHGSSFFVDLVQSHQLRLLL
jgi:two-component system sensor histidine kinase QseC